MLTTTRVNTGRIRWRPMSRIASNGLWPKYVSIVRAEWWRDPGRRHAAGGQDVQPRSAEEEDQHDSEPERWHRLADVGEHRRDLVEERIAPDSRVDADQYRDTDPDDEGKADEDKGREGGSNDPGPTGSPLSTDTPKSREGRRCSAADGLRQDVRPASRADKRGGRRKDPPDLVVDVGIARRAAAYWMRIGWSRPRLLKCRDPRASPAGCWRTAPWAPGAAEDRVDDDRDAEGTGIAWITRR
jgi:hypothetical protein